MMRAQDLTRRAMVAAGITLASFAAARAQSVWLGARRLTFEMWRNQRKIGRHSLEFKGDAKNFVATIDATAKISVGPLTVFQYQHETTETWLDGRFSAFQSRAVTNGKVEWVAATRSADGVLIRTAAGSLVAPPSTLPLTHWNRQALHGPLFDFQTGKLLRESVASHGGETVQTANSGSVVATRYSLSGDLDVVEWYDAHDDWVAMRIKAMDGSYIDYRRTA
jgi:hypothetical protein